MKMFCALVEVISNIASTNSPSLCRAPQQHIKSRAIRHIVLGAICAISSLSGAAQLLPSGVQGPLDPEIPTPVQSQKAIGYKDASALAEISSYEAAIGGSSWTGMQANGTLTFSDSPDALPAVIQMLPGNRTKLDITKPEGHDVTVFNGIHGAVTYAGAKTLRLPALSAAAGLAPFDLPITATLPTVDYSIIDAGVVVDQGRSLHRITIEIPIPPKEIFPGGKLSRTVVDLYFDPTTHLLFKSASLVAIPGSTKPSLLRATTYTNYSSYGAILLPTTIAETINGQAIWTITLTNINLNNLPSSKTFTF